MTKSIFSTIMDRLSNEPFLKNFKWRKRDNALIEKQKWGWRQILLGRYVWGTDEIRVWVFYSVRFNIINQWYENFCYIDPASQRMHDTVNGNINTKYGDYYDFKRDWSNFEEMYNRLKNDIYQFAKKFFNDTENIEKLYNLKVKPIIELERFPDFRRSSVTSFIVLGICKIVAPNNLHKLIQIVREDFLIRLNLPPENPDVTPYINRLDEIFHYLENYDFIPLIKKEETPIGNIVLS